MALEVVLQVHILLPKSKRGGGLIFSSFCLFKVRLRLVGEGGSCKRMKSVVWEANCKEFARMGVEDNIISKIMLRVLGKME
jgi:hypothetical protein